MPSSYHFTFHIVHIPPTHIMNTNANTKYVFLETRIQSEWKSSLAKQWTVPFSLCAANMVEIESKEKSHFFLALQGKKLCENIIFELGEFTAHTRALNGREQTITRMGKTHTDSYVVLCLMDDVTVACLLASSSVYILHYFTGFSVVHSIKFTSTILCDGCSQPLKMQEGHTKRIEQRNHISIESKWLVVAPSMIALVSQAKAWLARCPE